MLLGDLKGFEAPDFMLNKIRAFVSQARTDGKDQSSITYLGEHVDVSTKVCDRRDVNRTHIIYCIAALLLFIKHPLILYGFICRMAPDTTTTWIVIP